LASFTIPETLLGVLGLSQVVYVTGKLVTPASSSELNDATKALRELERKFKEAAAITPDPTPPAGTDKLEPPSDLQAAIRRAGRDKYNAYIDAARNVRIQFQSVTGRDVDYPKIEPSFS